MKHATLFLSDCQGTYIEEVLFCLGKQIPLWRRSALNLERTYPAVIQLSQFLLVRTVPLGRLYEAYKLIPSWSLSDMSRQMSKLLPIVLLEIQLHMIAALFTVKVLQPHYTAEYGRDVIMGCRFPVHSPLNLMGLSVSWQRKLSLGDKEVYKLNNGQEDLARQDSDYRGRASLSREELDKGLSLLSITNVKLTDAGVYICVVKYEGADYKYITLEVGAPYKRINLQERREEEDLVLTCHSEGYPLAEVSWHHERNLNASIHANTTYELTRDGLFNITSILRVRPSTPGNYSCAFWNQELNQETSANTSLVLPDKTSPAQNRGKSPISFILPICLLAFFLLIAIAIKVQRSKSSTNLRTRKGKRRKFQQFLKSV